MSQDSSAEYYRDNKERLEKSLSEEEKEKNDNMGVDDIKISLKMRIKHG